MTEVLPANCSRRVHDARFVFVQSSVPKLSMWHSNRNYNYSQNSTWLVTSYYVSVRRDTFDVSSASSHAVRQVFSHSPTLVVRPTRCSTPGDRAFPVTAARAWNSLPPAVRDAPLLLSFRSCLKTWLFWTDSGVTLTSYPAALRFTNSVKCACHVIDGTVSL